MTESKERNSINVNTIDEYFDIVKKVESGWMFRGQADDWELKTTFGRYIKNYLIKDVKELKIEERLIGEFKRRYREGKNPALESSSMFTLALMQHYGAPTRLLDFTYSPYVALYFALTDSIGENDSLSPVVWCVNNRFCCEKVKEIAGKDFVENRNSSFRDTDKSDTIYFENPKKFVFAESPFHLNDRLGLQQGVFLCPSRIDCSFKENFEQVYSPDDQSNCIKIKLVFDRQKRIDCLKVLNRMNINSESLFPGLDGFSKSLAIRLLWINFNR